MRFPGVVRRAPKPGTSLGMSLGISLALAIAATALPATAAIRDPACRDEAVVVRSGVVSYPLAAGFIRPGTDTVRTRSTNWTRGTDYVLDRTRGVLRLLREPVAGETLWVTCCRLLAPPPLELQRLAWRRGGASDPGAAADSADTVASLPYRPVTGRIPSEAPVGTSLALTGNKTVAVDFGSRQDAFLRQSLDLAVSGTLAPGVELTGVLTDRNTPLSAEGTTRDLQSLDRLLIELRTPTAVAQLGDVGLSLTGNEFGRLERRLQGVRAAYDARGSRAEAAAATADGEYQRIEFFGIEGRQGPYGLNASGQVVAAVVAGSEIVQVDGRRLTRGESADYSIDYERGLLTFTNRLPITSTSRITVEFQSALQRFRRNLAALSARREFGGFRIGGGLITESDDRGRPIVQALDASDRLVLSNAGDSLALGGGVTAGGGDYDLIQGATGPYYAFAGVDSGSFGVRFARVTGTTGDYAESTTVSSRIVYRHVGAGQGTHVIGRTLPLAETHQLATLNSGFAHGPFDLSLEGALSRLDRNTFSASDDDDNVGQALDAQMRLEGAPGALGLERAGFEARARHVDPRFVPFMRLEAPFVEEEWGLPPGTDLTHQTRYEASAFVRPRRLGEARVAVGRLETPDGFTSDRRSLSWVRDGVLRALARWDVADGVEQGKRLPDGGRDHLQAELGARLQWFEPAVRAEWDERRSPSDTGYVGGRDRRLDAELRTPGRMTWRSRLLAGVQREGARDSLGFRDVAEAVTGRFEIESPAAHKLTVATQMQRRDRKSLEGGPRTRSDLASVLVRGVDLVRGVTARAQTEVTSEGESPRTRVLTFVGPGLGAYDSLGNFTGNGAYDLTLATGAGLVQIARVASSAQLAWTFGSSDVWRGSRVELVFESDARRRGELHPVDVVLPPAIALGDADLSRALLVQRAEVILAPGSTAGDVRMRLERRASADRQFENFAQTLDQSTANLRWRARGSGPWGTELEGRWRRRTATQSLGSGTPFERTLLDAGGTGQLVFTPGPRLRVVAVTEATWLRPERVSGIAGSGTTRTIRLGPDLGLGVGRQGRLDITARRSFLAGPPALALLPTPDPADAPRWEGTMRFDLRLLEGTSAGVTFTAQERPGREAIMTGRAEVRAFF